MRDFKPGLWPTLISIPAVLVMIGFGVWQLERLAWKNQLLDRIQARMAAPAAGLAQLTGDAEQEEYRHVRLRGNFAHERELFLVARSLNGNVGSQILTKLVLDNGQSVLVDRGWVPEARQDAARRAEGQIKGPVELLAVVRRNQVPGWFTPANDPTRNIWFFIDVAAMRRALGIADGLDYWYAVEAPPNPGGFPIGGQTRVNIPNDHLQYAVTWFIFAVTLSVIYVFYGRRRARERAKAPSSAP